MVMRAWWNTFIRRHCVVLHLDARVVELVDTLALGASAFGREGSSPFARTMALY